MESFSSSMKTEMLSRKVYRTREDACADVFEYVERFYSEKTLEAKLPQPCAVRELKGLTQPSGKPSSL
jgi:transposase InsO family protein